MLLYEKQLYQQYAILYTIQATREYVYDVNIFIATYGLVLGTQYLVGFILLVIIYTKLLRYIKRIRNDFGKYCITLFLSSPKE